PVLGAIWDPTESRKLVMNALEIAELANTSSEHLELLVQSRLGGRVRDLRVLIRQDGVILQGRAGTYHAKQLAQHAAMELIRLPIVANDIEVCLRRRLAPHGLLDPPGVGPIDMVLPVPVPAEQNGERQLPGAGDTDADRNRFFAPP